MAFQGLAPPGEAAPPDRPIRPKSVYHPFSIPDSQNPMLRQSYPILHLLLLVAGLLRPAAHSGREERVRLLDRADSLMQAREFEAGLAAYEAAGVCAETAPHSSDSLDARFHRDYAAALARRSRLDEATVHVDLALEAWRGLGGPRSAGYGIALERKARTLAMQWRIDEARPVFEEALAVLTETRGPEDLETLTAEHGLAFCLENQDRQGLAVEHYERVLRGRENRLPADDLLIAWTCHDFAVALHGLGRLGEAEELYRRAYTLRRGREDGFATYSARGYATCLLARGDFRTALAVLTEVQAALAADPTVPGTLRLGVYEMLAYTALMADDLDSCRRWIAAFDTLAESSVFDRRIHLNILEVRARLLGREGSIAASAAAWHEYLELHGREFGADSPLRVAALGHLADLAAREGARARSDSLYRAGLALVDPDAEPQLFASLASRYARYLERRRRLLDAAAWSGRAVHATEQMPSSHGIRTTALEAHARIALARRDPATAWDAALLATRGSLDRYTLNLQSMGHDRIRAYRSQEHGALDLLLELLESPDLRTPSRVRSAWALVMVSRGAHLDEIRRRAQFPEPDSLRALKRRLADILTVDPFDARSPAPPTSIADLRSRISEAETGFLATRSAGETEAVFDVGRLGSHLRPGETLVSYVAYAPAGDSPRMGAFTRSSAGTYGYHPLGPADAVDTLVDDLHARLREAPSEVILDPDSSEARFRAAAGRLRARILDPLAVPETDSLVVVPVGSLWRLDFLALPASGGRYLAEVRDSFRIAESERALFRTVERTGGYGLLAVGGVDYSPWRRHGLPLEDLPRSEEEVRRIADLWSELLPAEPAEIRVRAEATEGAVTSGAPGKRVLHLATHGHIADHPGVPVSLAGLVLSRGPCDSCSATDGLWTELDAALTDLSGVALVFLSSCRSAGSRVFPGEGLAGLQRSLRLAGAYTTILTVWDVGDRPSRDWCSAFYRTYLSSRKSPSACCFHTSREILRTRRSMDRPTHPYYWGGFIAVGGES